VVIATIGGRFRYGFSGRNYGLQDAEKHAGDSLDGPGLWHESLVIRASRAACARNACRRSTAFRDRSCRSSCSRHFYLPVGILLKGTNVRSTRMSCAGPRGTRSADDVAPDLVGCPPADAKARSGKKQPPTWNMPCTRRIAALQGCQPRPRRSIAKAEEVLQSFRADERSFWRSDASGAGLIALRPACHRAHSWCSAGPAEAHVPVLRSFCAPHAFLIGRKTVPRFSERGHSLHSIGHVEAAAPARHRPPRRFSCTAS